MKISLVCTVKNEADNIAALLESMLAQELPPDEIVINDCGSSDATPAIVKRYAERDGRIRLVSGGFNIPSGRNNAIAHARYPIVACTDAGLTLDRAWLRLIVAPLQSGQADMVGGFHRAVPRSLFELALAATNYRNPDEVKPESFLPFGQSVAFRKEAWELVGGYPEWANHCEDILFDFAIKQAGLRIAFEPEAIVHFRPRSSFGSFFRQYYNYAIGDGRANLWPRRHAIRYLTYAFGGVALVQLRSKHALLRWSTFAAACVGMFGYTRKPFKRLLPQLKRYSLGRRIYALSLVPCIRVVGDLAKMIGYPIGIRRRLQNPKPATHSAIDTSAS
jgi:glycosyltransferase involved in cell wall biosynthesis